MKTASRILAIACVAGGLALAVSQPASAQGDAGGVYGDVNPHRGPVQQPRRFGDPRQFQDPYYGYQQPRQRSDNYYGYQQPRRRQPGYGYEQQPQYQYWR